MNRLMSLLAVALVCASSSAVANTHLVRKDGTGAFLTVADAIAAAEPQDYIVVGPGVYAEPLVVDKNLSIQSELNPESTILDGGDSHRVLRVRAGVQLSITGFTFARGRDVGVGGDGAGAAIFAEADVVIDATNCRFTENVSYMSAVAVSGGEVRFYSCTFSGNVSTVGAAVGVSGWGIRAENCLFVDNISGGVAGAIATTNRAFLQISQCVFIGNKGSAGAGAIHAYLGHGWISASTFVDQGSLGTASVHLKGGASTVQFDHNIVFGDVAGYGLIDEGIYSRSCNLYFGNARGSIGGSALGASELESNPLFCDIAGRVLSLSTGSPAAPQNGACGLLGAISTGCDGGPVEIDLVPFGSIKALFR